MTVQTSPNLVTHYPDLIVKLHERLGGTDATYRHIFLNPYQANEFLVVWSDNTLSWKLPPSFAKFADALAEWARGVNPGVPAELPACDVQGIIARAKQSQPVQATRAIDSTSGFQSDAAAAAAATSRRASAPPQNAHRGYPPARPVPQHMSTAPVQRSAHAHTWYRPPAAVPTAYSPPTSPLYSASPFASPASYPYSPPAFFSGVQDTSAMQMLRYYQTMNKIMTHVFSNAASDGGGGYNFLGGGQAFGNSGFGTGGLWNGGFGGGGWVGGDSSGGALSMSPLSMFGGGDPTSLLGGMLGGGDPTGGMTNPLTTLSSFGMDPTSLMSSVAITSGCTIM